MKSAPPTSYYPDEWPTKFYEGSLGNGGRASNVGTITGFWLLVL